MRKIFLDKKVINLTNKSVNSFSKNKPIVLTIAIPTMNSAQTLQIPMESILNQKNNGFKVNIVLLDSGSNDNTKEIFFYYKDRLNLIFKDIGRCSIGKARNYAIEFIKTDYLIFLDSDDALIKDRLFSDYKIISKSNMLNFIYGDSLQINKNSFENSYYCRSTPFAEKYQFLNIPYNLSSLTILRSFLLKKKISFNTGKEGRLGEDWRFINLINSNTQNYLYSPFPKVVINSREDSHTQDSIKCDLNISKINFLSNLFAKIRKKNDLLMCLFLSSQIQSSLILGFINIFLYTYPKKKKKYLLNFKNILLGYKSISKPYIMINIFLIPLSIYLILFVHRRSIYSPLRTKISKKLYKNYCEYLES